MDGVAGLHSSDREVSVALDDGERSYGDDGEAVGGGTGGGESSSPPDLIPPTMFTRIQRAAQSADAEVEDVDAVVGSDDGSADEAGGDPHGFQDDAGDDPPEEEAGVDEEEEGDDVVEIHNADAEEGDDDDVNGRDAAAGRSSAPSATTTLGMSRARKLVKLAASGSKVVSKDAISATVYSVEHCLQRIVAEAEKLTQRRGKKTITYESIAEVIAMDDALAAVLMDVLPTPSRGQPLLRHARSWQQPGSAGRGDAGVQRGGRGKR